MRVLVTGSSGQIGTNLALRLLGEGHEVFGVDKRLNGWTDDFRYLLQDLSGHYAAMRAASAASSTRPPTSSSISPRTRRCTSSSASPPARSRT